MEIHEPMFISKWTRRWRWWERLKLICSPGNLPFSVCVNIWPVFIIMMVMTMMVVMVMLTQDHLRTHTILFSGNIKYRSQTIQKHLSFLIWNYLDCDSCDWRDTLAGLKRNLKNCWKYRWPRLKLKYCSPHGVNLRPERAVHESWVHRQSTLHHPQLPSPPWFSVLVHIISFCLVIINDSSSCHAVIMSPYYHHQVIRSPGTKRGCVCWILGVAGHNDNHHRILIITRLGWWSSSHSRCLWWYDNLG